MEYDHARTVITHNKGDYFARTVESETVVDIDQKNVAANRITFQKRVMSTMIYAWVDYMFDESNFTTITLQK